MSSGGFTNYTLGSLQCVIVNRHNVLDGISVQKEVRVINDVALCRDLIVNNFNNFFRFEC
jgi:hypothetical protein